MIKTCDRNFDWKDTCRNTAVLPIQATVHAASPILVTVHAALPKLGTVHAALRRLASAALHRLATVHAASILLFVSLAAPYFAC